MWDPSKSALESQYGRARENVLGNMPSGGALQQQLTNLEMGRAQGLGDISKSIAEDEYNKIYSAAMGAPQVSIGGMSQLAATRAGENIAEQQMKGGAKQGMGAGAGMLLAAFL